MRMGKRTRTFFFMSSMLLVAGAILKQHSFRKAKNAEGTNYFINHNTTYASNEGIRKVLSIKRQQSDIQIDK